MTRKRQRMNIRYAFGDAGGRGKWEEMHVPERLLLPGNEKALRDEMSQFEDWEGPRQGPDWRFKWEVIPAYEAKVKWLLETETFEAEVMVDLQNAITACGMEFKLLDFHTWEDDSQFSSKYHSDECVLFYGSLGAAQRIQRSQGWVPGVWLNLNNFECTMYYNHFGKYLLNREYIMLPFGELNRQKEFLFSTLGNNGQLFVRPSSGLKLFNGSIVSESNWAKDYELLAFYDVEPQKVVVVAKPQTLYEEWRLMVVGGRVVSGSQYKNRGVFGSVPGFPEDVREFGNEVASVWQPDLAWTLDVARTDAGLKLIEINSFSCSGMYLCDKIPLVQAAAELALKEWKEAYEDVS